VTEPSEHEFKNSARDGIRVRRLVAAMLLAASGATATAAALAQTDAAGQPTKAAGPTVEIFAAGSLRGVVSDLAKEADSAFHIEVKASFGGSGSMRERIEKGETPDMLMSADLGSPQKLQSEGRTVVPVIAFARNRMCIVSRRSAGVTAKNLIDRLLAKNVRVKTSTPIVDPSGDYAWAIFDRVDALRPGAGAKLKDEARALWSVSATPAPGQSAAAALFASKQIDMAITYCSGSATLEKEVPELSSLVVPPQLDPHPVYGVAVLSNKPQALRVALLLLSEKGQAIIAHNGLVPLTDAANRTPE
jgi:molybdate transport system substrate-binding protein